MRLPLAEGHAVARPLYSQVRDILLKRVRSGEWAAGETLPNEFELGRQCGVSIGTIRRAIEGLEELGVVVRKQGRGTFVSGPGPLALAEKFNRLKFTGGGAPSFTLVSLVRRNHTPDEASALSLAADAEVYEILQTVLLGASSIGIEHSVIPARIFPRLETQLTFGQHLYPVLEHYGVLVTRIAETVSVLAPDATFAALAGEAGAPMLAVVRTAFSIDVPVERRRARSLGRGWD
jgi:GntR family transcriptional regulator